MNSLLILHKWKVTLENQAQILRLHVRPAPQVGGAAACRFLVLMTDLAGSADSHLGVHSSSICLWRRTGLPMQIPSLYASSSLQAVTPRFWMKPASYPHICLTLYQSLSYLPALDGPWSSHNYPVSWLILGLFQGSWSLI